MKIKILGAGAMGSLFGGRLALAGAHVELLATNTAHRDAINAHGLNLSLDDGAFNTPLAAVHPEHASGPADLIILFTKTTQSRAALASVPQLLADASAPHVMSVQNGLGNLELLSQFVPAERIIYGMSTTPADLLSPGQVSSHGPSHTAIMTGHGEVTAFVQEVAALITRAGLPCEVDQNVQVSIWEKVAFNSALSAVPGVTRTTGRMLSTVPEAMDLVHALACETCQIAHANDVAVDPQRVHALIDLAIEKHPDHKASLLRDLLTHRPTEIDSLNGAVLKAAARVDMLAPLNDTMYRLVKLAEQSQD